MKLKILVKIAELILGTSTDANKPRGDMYLPDRLLAMALVFLAGGTVCVAVTVIRFTVWVLLGAVGCLGLGVGALLCWKNQSIHIISEEQFTYTTMFGNTRTYAFEDIIGLRKNQDSLTLYVAGDKVHIESMAILSNALVQKINEALAQRNA